MYKTIKTMRQALEEARSYTNQNGIWYLKRS